MEALKFLNMIHSEAFQQSIACNGCRVYLQELCELTDWIHKDINEWTFGVQIDNKPMKGSLSYHFSTIVHFNIPITSPTMVRSSTVTLLVKPRDGSFDWMKVALWTIKRSFSVYDVHQKETLQLNTIFQVQPFECEIGDGGVMQLYSSSDIMICDGAGIVADGAGLQTKRDFDIYREYVDAVSEKLQLAQTRDLHIDVLAANISMAKVIEESVDELESVNPVFHEYR